MKLETLLETADEREAIEIHKKFKEVAKGLEVRQVNGQAGPHMTTKGAWYGGGFTPEGGQTAERKAGDDRIPFDLRVRGYLKHVASVLEQHVKAGDVVKIAKGPNRNNVTDVKAGDDVFKLLQQNVIKTSSSMWDNAMDSVMWFIGQPDDGTRLVHMYVSVSLRYDTAAGAVGDRHKGMNYSASVDNAEYLALQRKFNSLAKKATGKTYLYVSQRNELQAKLIKALPQLIDDKAKLSFIAKHHDDIDLVSMELKQHPYEKITKLSSEKFMEKLKLVVDLLT
jgi:hypothetical protein